MNPSPHAAAKDHLTLDFNGWSDACWLSLTENLVTLRRFKRSGSAIIGASEHIHQTFNCTEFSLAAGWDNGSGHYLLSNSVAGDSFLQVLFEALSG